MLRQAAKAVLIAVGALVALYLVGANVFLRTGGVQKIFASVYGVEVDVGRAWTVWPGRIHVRDLRVAVQDSNVQMSFDFPRVSVQLSLPDLIFRKTFHARSVRGEGLAFRFRHRISPAAAGLPSTHALPEFPEFQNEFLETVKKHGGKPWAIHFEDVDVGVSELWIQQFQYFGRGRARGAFRLEPGKWLWVRPASLELEPGPLTAGPHRIARALSGRIECTVHPHDVNRPQGREVFRLMNAGIDLDLDGAELDAAELFVPPRARLRVDSEPGHALVRVRTIEGRPTEESHIRLETPRLSVGAPRWKAVAKGVELALDDAEGRGEARLALASAVLERPGRGGSPPRVERLLASLASSTSDVSAPWKLDSAEAQARELRADDLRWFDDLTRSRGVQLDRGAVRAHGHARWQPGNVEASVRAELDASGRAKQRAFAARGLTLAVDGRYAQELFDGWLDLDAERVVASIGQRRVRAAPSLKLRLGSFDPTLRGGSALLDLVVRRFSSTSSGGARCESARVARATVRAEVAFTGEERGRGALSARLDGVDARFGALTVRGNARLEANAEGGADERAPARVSVRGSVSKLDLKSGSEATKGWQARVPELSVVSRLFGTKEALAGPVEVSAPRARGRIGATPAYGDVKAKLDFAKLAANEGGMVASAALDLDRVALGSESPGVRDWWARVRLPSIVLGPQRRAELVTRFSAEMRDGRPGLALLARGGKLPGWLSEALPLNSLEATGEIRRRCRVTEISFARVRGGPLVSAGRIQKVPGDVRAVFEVELDEASAVSAGLVMFGKRFGVSPAPGDEWLDEQYRRLDGHAADSVRGGCHPTPDQCSR